MTAVLTASTQVLALPEQVHEPWTRETVIDAFTAETGLDRHKVRAFVDSMRGKVRQMIVEGDDYWLPSQEWLAKHHAVLVAGIPDHAVSAPGTAHRGLEELVVPSTEGVLTITHDMRRDAGVRHCAVTIGLKSALL